MNLMTNETETIAGLQLPSMRVDPPGPECRRWAEELIKVESPGASGIATGKIPIFWAEAQGANVTDLDGNVYVDLTAGFCAATAGHSNPRVADAIADQAHKLLHCQGALHPCVPRARLLKKLGEITPGNLNSGMILSTGAEAVELAFKTCKLYTGKPGLIAFHGGFHGKTFGALSLTSRNAYKTSYGPLLPGVVHVPYAYCYRCAFDASYPDCNLLCARYLENVLKDPASSIGEIGGIRLEPVQGHEGWIVPPPGYLPRIREICDKYSLLMIVDEVLNGFGRTGEWFAIDNWNVVPDIIAMGKGMASGFPISVTLSTTEFMGAWQPRETESAHSSTFLGHPVACAGGFGLHRRVGREEPDSQLKRLGERLLGQFRQLQAKYEMIGDVRGKGLMAGFEIVADRATKEPAPRAAARVVDEALRRGVIINRGGRFENVLKSSPPLVITEAQLDAAVAILDESFAAAGQAKL